MVLLLGLSGGFVWFVWRVCRRGICQIFYTSKITKSVHFSRHFWPKIENGGCFAHLFWTNCQFLCNYLLEYKLTPVVLWKSSMNSANITDMVIFRIDFWKFYLSPKNFIQMSFVTFVTNSTSVCMYKVTIVTIFVLRVMCFFSIPNALLFSC